MRYSEIMQKNAHPYVAILTIDPVHFRKLQILIEGRPEVRLIDYDDSGPDCWTITIACASAEVASRLEDGWG